MQQNIGAVKGEKIRLAHKRNDYFLSGQGKGVLASAKLKALSDEVLEDLTLSLTLASSELRADCKPRKIPTWHVFHLFTMME